MKVKILCLVMFMLILRSLFAQTDTLWTKIIGKKYNDVINCIMPTRDGGYIIVGNAYHQVRNDYDIFLIRTDSYGDTLWTRTIGGPGNEFGNCVDTTTDGGYIITGAKPRQNYNDVWLVKTNSNGDTAWTKTIGRYNHDVGYCVKQTDDDGYIIMHFSNRSMAI